MKNRNDMSAIDLRSEIAQLLETEPLNTEKDARFKSALNRNKDAKAKEDK